MPEHVSPPDLEVLWVEPDPDSLICFHCEKAIGREDVLMRTFRLLTCNGTEEPDEPIKCSRRVRTNLSDDVLLYDRHLDCLLSSGTRYLAISHVWHPEISETQAQGHHSPQDVEVRRMAFELPGLVYRNLERELGGYFEIWHDYISVPQWTESLKTNVLLNMHIVYETADTTVVHMHDLEPATIDQFINGKTRDDRLMGMVGICNAAWYGRVWTAMEYIRSRSIRMMAADYSLVDERYGALFLDRFNDAWGEGIRSHRSVHELEAKIGIGKNIVPWNLGPLAATRAKQTRNFGLAYVVLARRCCRSRDDFLYALHGIIKCSAEPLDMKQGWDEIYRSLARYCLVMGDYTPFLITPEGGQAPFPLLDLTEGYNDVVAYSLGPMESPPAYHAKSHFKGDSACMELEKVGAVSMLNRAMETEPDPLRNLAVTAMFALDATGPDVDAFVETLAVRLYFMAKDFVEKSLNIDRSRRPQLQSVLEQLYNNPRARQWPMSGLFGVQWLAETLGISKEHPYFAESRLMFMHAQGGVLHGVDNNWLLWATCPSCLKSFMYRAAIYVLPAEVRGAMAYRIPGMKFWMSQPNGVCLLVKECGRIVGRMIWATPACECREVERVRLTIPALPRPKTREDVLREQGRL